MKQLRKLSPLSWGLNLILGLMLVIGLAEGTVTAAQVGETIRVSVGLGWETAGQVLNGLFSGLG